MAVVEGMGVFVGATTGVEVGVVTGGGGTAFVGVVAAIVEVLADEIATVEPSTGFTPKVVMVWGFSW